MGKLFLASSLIKSRRDRCQRKSKLVKYQREDETAHRHWQPSQRWTFFNELLEKAELDLTAAKIEAAVEEHPQLRVFPIPSSGRRIFPGSSSISGMVNLYHFPLQGQTTEYGIQCSSR